MEGTRPLLVELQALVAPTNLAFPMRRVTGFDYNRTLLLLAVLERRAGLTLSRHDVFVNVAGGVRVTEPAADLGLCVAVASSLKNMPAYPDDALAGEVGLAGEIRSVPHLERRISEAKKLGFKRFIAAPGRGLKLKEEYKQVFTPADSIVRALAEVLDTGRIGAKKRSVKKNKEE